MAYDDLNRLVSMTQDPGGLNLVTTHMYDENGNETLLTDPKGQTVTSTYDELNRLKTKTYAFAAGDSYRPWRHTRSVTYTYDANSNLTNQDESVASGTDPPTETLSIVRTFDDLDRLLIETEALPDGGTKTATFTYFANGTRRTTTDDTGTRTYTYDGQNRLESVTDATGTTTYTYWPDDLQKTVTSPDGVVATHGYDKADRLTSVVSTKAGATITAYAYTYDRNGNRLTQAETNGAPAETTTYTYDGLNRLATVTYPPEPSHPDGRNVAYGYDAVGNRTGELTTNPATSATIASKSGAFNNVNRLTTLTDTVDPGQTTTFTWDPNGNQTSKTVGGTTTEYRYDIRDKLVEVAQDAGILERLQYDAEGRLLKKIGESGIRQYLYDQTSRLVEYDETGASVASYSYGSDRLISLQHRTEGTRFYHLDGLGSVTALTDPAGAVTSRLHLDAWGIFKNPTELDGSANRHAFTGYVFERETGLYFAKARFYDPEVGRFTSQDSFLGEINDPPSLHRYFYANANPTRFIDPTGHQAQSANGEGTTLDEALQSYRESQAAQEAQAAAAKKPSPWETLKERGEAFVRWGKSFFVSEDGPGSGDPTDSAETHVAVNALSDPTAQITALQERTRRTLEAGATVGKVGGKLGREAISFGGGTVTDAYTAATGVDPGTEEQFGAGGRFTAVAGAVIPGISGRDLRFGKKALERTDELADVANSGRRAGWREALGEGPEVDAMRVTGARGAGMASRPRHHVFPQEHRAFFEDRGFVGERSIDNFTIELAESTHQAVHGGGNFRLGRRWTGEWNKKIMGEVNRIEREVGRPLKFEEVMSVGEDLVSRYGIEGSFVPYRR